MSRYTRRHITVTLRDGAAHSWALGPTPGDFACPAFEEQNLEALDTMDLGDFDGRVYGDQLAQDWTITVELPNESLTHAAANRMLDWIRKTGQCATYTSVDATVWAVEVEVELDDGTTTATITLNSNRLKGDLTVAKEGCTIALQGRNTGGYTIA